jgi:hypothetical protein
VAPIAIALLAFALALAAILVGSVMQRMLPERHLSSDSKEVVKLSMGVVATLAALVLGLLVASAKSTYDARESEINQLTAYVILLDNLLAKYGEGAEPARASLRQAIPPSSTEFGEKDNRCRCSQRHLKLWLRVKVPINEFRNSNQAMTSNADFRREYFRLPMI